MTTGDEMKKLIRGRCFPLQLKVSMTLEGQRIRYITTDSKVRELLAPH